MSQIHPKISLGMPVFNGENYIEPAIRSILDQTYSDFELVISDNASGDRTEEICRDYAGKDSRIRYYRNDSNVGAARNFNRTVELAKGDFFKWAAHDDTLAPEYLERCLQVLEQDESLILCFPKTILVDHRGDKVGKYEVSMKNISSARPELRFRDLILTSHWGIEIFGLFRKSALDSTALLASFPGSDRTFMAELSLEGRFYEIPEYLFYSRDHPERSTRTGTVHTRASWWDTRNAGSKVFPHWKLYYELLRIVNNARLMPGERAACYMCLARWLTLSFNAVLMLMDLAIAVEPRSWKFAYGVKKKLSRKRKKAVMDKKDDLMSRNPQS
ncbi:MAG: glycosyltransferase family 2 protein [Deltaproteobacteria bacterium]